MKKRILSLLLALALLCAMLPQIALPARAEDANSGTCGDNLTWTFDPQTGTLTIEGSGAMDDYYDKTPWEAHRNSIQKVVLPAGLTEIGHAAFADCTGLTEITFPEGLTEIGSYAFSGCTGLTEITFPDGLTKIRECVFSDCTGLTQITFPAGLTVIGSYAFYGCTGLTQITLPAGLTVIGSYAFYGCTGLTEITLPAGLTEISSSAFSGCTGLRSFSVAAENPSFSTDACGVLLNKDKTKLVCYPGGRTGSYAIPQSVTSVGDTAFYGCTGLTEITLPAGLTEIGSGAFEDCTGLTEITLPAGLTEIGSSAFSGCTGLTSVTFPDGLTEIGWDAFEGCTGLTSVTFPDGLTEIDYSAFSGCTGLTSVTFPDGLTSIGGRAFEYCTGLTSVTFPDGLTSIGDLAFCHCDSLTSFSVSKDNPYFSTDAIGILFNKEKTELILYPSGRSGSYTVPNSVTSVGDSAFDGCTGLTSVTLPDGLTSIGDSAFNGCTGLTEITIPEGLQNIGSYAFNGIWNMKSVSIPENVCIIGKNAFGYNDYYSKSESFTIYGYNETAAQAYAQENGFSFVSLGAGHHRCGKNLTWSFDKRTGTLTIKGSGKMFDFRREWQPWSANRESLQKIVLPDGLTYIGQSAFPSYPELTSVTFPDGLTYIGEGAFGGCTGLTEITLPDGLTYIGEVAFGGCTGLTEITLPDGLTEIGRSAFYGCTGLTSVTFPDGLTEIGDSAFEDCTGLTSVALPDGLTSIGNWAFDDCSSLSTADLSKVDGNVLGADAMYLFAFCENLKTVKLPASLPYIPCGMFMRCESLTTIDFPENLTSIGHTAFYGCSSLTAVNFPAGLTSIDSNAFDCCSRLTVIDLPVDLTSLAPGSFSDCTKLTAFHIDSANQHFCTDENGVLFNKDQTELVRYPSGKKDLSYTIPSGLSNITEAAFKGSRNLTSVILPEGLSCIGKEAFVNVPLNSIIIPKSVQTVDPCAVGWNVEEWFSDGMGGSNGYQNHDVIIYGCKGTAAQDYAKENGFKFVPLDPQSGFADVKPKQYYYKPMLWAVQNGITSGTSRVTFSPNDTCTRGQVMTFLYAAKGKPEANWDNNPFVDVKKSKFYFKPVLWAVQNGITNGMDATHFQPNGGCTRAQVVTFLWAMRGKPEPKAGNNPFTDIKKSNWYYKAVLWASQNGITNGVDATHFGPNQTCTRGQVVTFLYALLGDK